MASASANWSFPTEIRFGPGRIGELAETCAAMLRESGGDGLKAFYRGVDLKLLRAVPASAVSFFAYEEARRWLERE